MLGDLPIKTLSIFYPHNPYSIGANLSLTNPTSPGDPFKTPPGALNVSIDSCHHRNPSAAFELSYTT